MPGGYKNIKHEDGNRFTSENQPKNNGRKKKIHTILKESGFCNSDILEVFGEMMWYELKDLREVFKDESKPAIMRMAANQIYLAISKGDFGKVKDMMEYVISKAKTVNLHEGSEDAPLKTKIIIAGKEFEV